jgi:hypothetical protein
VAAGASRRALEFPRRRRNARSTATADNACLRTADRGGVGRPPLGAHDPRARTRAYTGARRAGVHLWRHNGQAVYVGVATRPRGRAWRKHLGAGASPSGSSLRRNVCALLFGIPPNITGRLIKQKVTTEQAAAIRDWLLACELSWLLWRHGARG